MSNGLHIKNQEDFTTLYKDDPGLAMGLIFENLADIKAQCECRLKTCKAEQKRDRLKNAAMQGGGGIVGGAVTLWIYLKLSVSQFFNN